MIEIVHIGATWQIQLNFCFLWTIGVLNPNGISIGSASLCTAHGRMSSGTLAPPGEYDWNCAQWCHLANTIELLLLSAHPSPQTQTANRPVQPLLHSSQQKVPILCSGRPFSPKFPLLMGDVDPLLGPVQTHNQRASWSVQLFSHRWQQSVPMLYNGMPLTPSKLPLPMGDMDPTLMCGSLGPSESSTQTASRSV